MVGHCHLMSFKVKIRILGFNSDNTWHFVKKSLISTDKSFLKDEGFLSVIVLGQTFYYILIVK